jgi:hypothetical protein
LEKKEFTVFAFGNPTLAQNARRATRERAVFENHEGWANGYSG